MKRNGFDESLDAPKRDLSRMKELLLSTFRYFIDCGTISVLDIDDLLEAWLEWKVISISNIAYKELCREELIPIPDGYDNPMNEAKETFYTLAKNLHLRLAPNKENVIQPASSTPVSRTGEVVASHILITYRGANRADSKIIRSKETAKHDAERIHRSILNGELSFSELVAKYSDCPSKYREGDLGTFTFDVMAKPFSEAAFALDINDISNVVETEFGFHIIKRTK